MVARALRVIDRATGVPTRQRFEEVVCKLGEVRLRIGRAETLEDLPGPQVCRSSMACGECFVQGVADERVREAKPADRWRLGEYACCDRLVEQFESSRLRRSLPPRRAPWSRTPGRGWKQPRGGDDSRCQPPQPLTDYLSDGVGKLAAAASLVQRLVEPVLCLQQPHDLAHEQWIALGLGVDRASDRVGDVAPDDRVDHCRRVGGGQDRPGAGDASSARARATQGMRSGRLLARIIVAIQAY